MIEHRPPVVWAIAAATADTPTSAHRLDAADATYCGAPVDRLHEGRLPAGIAQCKACGLAISAYRRELERASVRNHRRKQAQQVIARLTQRTYMSPAQALAIDADSRRRERDSSVRTVRAASAGLPGLGRRR